MIARKQHLIQFFLFLVLMGLALPFTPLLRSPEGQKALSYFVPAVYGLFILYTFYRWYLLRSRKKNLRTWLKPLIFSGVLAGLVWHEDLFVEQLHYIQYITVYILCLRVFPYATNRHMVMALMISIGIGAADEGIQLFLRERVFDFRDISLNALGCIFGYVWIRIFRSQNS
ncbi:VanZ family protein [PVC group bacterium]|nr:VanZ family protein [PVC group bacterium]